MRAKPQASRLKKAVDAYLEAALWSSTDEDQEPMDDKYSADDFAPSALKQAETEVAYFLKEVDQAEAVLNDRFEERGLDPVSFVSAERYGRDFWLTRNGHGTGFWDRAEIYGEEMAELLSDIAHRAGERDVYAGDDGLVYFSPDQRSADLRHPALSGTENVINWTRPMLERFRKALAKAKGEAFIFEGNEFDPGYARYLIQYLETQLGGSHLNGRR